jgi:GNAT superfamily N-acetyltransferase
MNIIELKSAGEFSLAYPLLNQLNPTLSESEFNRRLKNMLARGYRCIAMVEDGKYLGVCGFWHGTRFWCGDYIDLDNVVVDEKLRSRNIGKKLLDWVEELARKLKCELLICDAYVTSNSAHRFYFREGYIIKGYHFIKPLQY